MKQNRGRYFALWLTGLAFVVVGVTAWRTWPYIVFWWRFEALGLNAKGYTEYRHRNTGLIFVRVPCGEFSMGASDDEHRTVLASVPEEQAFPFRRLSADELPQHVVRVSPFLMGKYEITQHQWHIVMGGYPSAFDGTSDFLGYSVDPPQDRDRLPVERVSWEQIQEFEAKTGLRLPTEAQWEFACRGGTQTAFSHGSGESCSDWLYAPCPERDRHMWYFTNSGLRTHEIGMKAPNPFGLHDMHGNVWEWVEDAYSEDFYSTPQANGLDPLCASGSGSYVIRGGGWCDYAWDCRCASRAGSGIGTRSIGFRVAYHQLPQ